MQCLKTEVMSNHVSIVFDGTTNVYEVIVMVLFSELGIASHLVAGAMHD